MIGDIKDGNSSPLINLNADQEKFVDDTNKLFSAIQNPLLKQLNERTWFQNLNPLDYENWWNLFHHGYYKDLANADYQKSLEIALQNTAIRRRVADALQSGVNPIFALNATGAGDSLSNSNVSSKNSDSMLSQMLKMILLLTFVAS